jgi:predicted nucleotidyltransferase
MPPPRCDDGLQVDFMATIHGVRSCEGVRDRSSTIEIDGVSLRVTALSDIIRSKRAAKRPRDLAALPVLKAVRLTVSHAHSLCPGVLRGRFPCAQHVAGGGLRN